MSFTLLANCNISTPVEPVKLDIKSGQPTFILGRNGTGKSALAQYLSSQLIGSKKIVYMPGSRPSYFDHESLTMTPQSRKDFDNNLSWYSGIDARWKSLAGTTHNEKAIHDLTAAETQYKIDIANQIKEEGKESNAICKLQENNSPLDKVNSLLQQANLDVQLKMHEGELKAQRSESIYSYAKMSDGERTALIFAAEVTSAKPKTIFIIDEPELHLHPSIVISLIRALVLDRADCGFVICTHELLLPQAVQNSQVILVRECTWESDTVTNWDIDLIENKDEIAEWLWVDVVGSRRIVLFVEGDEQSLDQPLYSILFPNATVRPCRSCKDVIEAVRGLNAMESKHRIKAFGLIDGDGMSQTTIERFQKDYIYPLPVYSVESLIYSEECMSAVSERQAETLSETKENLINTAVDMALNSLIIKGVKENLAARVAERKIREEILSKIPTHRNIKKETNTIDFSYENPYQNELSTISELIQNKNINEIIARYPIRESGIPKAVANAVRLPSSADYERAVIAQVQKNQTLQNKLKERLGELTAELSTASV